jgi:hypothetical protein
MEYKMKNKSLLTWTALSALFIIALISCKKVDLTKIATDAWSPILAVPIAKTVFTMEDLLAGKDSTGLILEEPDGALILVYSLDQDLASASDFVTLPSTSANFNESAGGYGLPFDPTYSGVETITISEEVDFAAPTGFKLFNIDFKSGIFVINVSSNLMHDVEFQFAFPDLFENGIPATSVIDLDYTTPGVMTGTDTIYLDVSTMDLTNGSIGYNQFNFTGEIIVEGTGNPLTGAESIDFSVDIVDPTFEEIHGDFGTQSIFDFSDTIPMQLFNNFQFGNIAFTNPALTFNFSNSFGVPIGLNFNKIEAIEENTGNKLLLTGLPSSFVIESPTSANLTKVSSLVLSPGNTDNIETILAPTPKKLVLDIGGEVNPGGGPSVNFITDESKLSVNVELNMPLEGYASNFIIRDTIPLSLDLPDFIDFVEFRLGAENGLPARIAARLIMVDENYDFLIELTDGKTTFLEAAPVDANGRVTESINTIVDLRLEQADVPKLRQSKYLVIEATANTFQVGVQQVVKLYADYEIGIRLGMKAQATINR